MKHLLLLTALLLGLLPSFAQVPNTQLAFEHIAITPNPTNGEVITFNSYTLIMNGEEVTRVGNSPSSNDWTKVYFVDGFPFHPHGAVEVGNTIAMVGSVGSNGIFVVSIDHNGTPLWTRSYPMHIDKMIVSINGNLLLATTYLGNNSMEYLLAEINPSNGNVMQVKRIGLPNFMGLSGTVADIDHNGVWYLGIVKAAGQTISITSDANLNPDKVMRHSSPQLAGFDIREIRQSIQGDFYVSGVDTQNDQFFCGKMSINQWFTDMRRIKIASGSFDYEMPTTGPISAESPNRVPYYHGGPWGSVTVVPGNAAFSFTGILTGTQTAHREAVLIQYDELWNLNYGVIYDHGLEVNQPNLVKRWNEQLVLVTTLDDFGNNRLIENRLADDFWGCFSEYVNVEESNIEVENEEMEHEVIEDEFQVMNHDLNEFTASVSSPLLCSTNKTDSEALDPQESIQLFPNPSTGTFTLAGVAQSEVEVYDIQGKMLRSYSPGTGQELLIQGLKPGVYLVKSKKNGKTETLKAVVQ